MAHGCRPDLPCPLLFPARLFASAHAGPKQDVRLLTQMRYLIAVTLSRAIPGARITPARPIHVPARREKQGAGSQAGTWGSVISKHLLFRRRVRAKGDAATDEPSRDVGSAVRRSTRQTVFWKHAPSGERGQTVSRRARPLTVHHGVGGLRLAACCGGREWGTSGASRYVCYARLSPRPPRGFETAHDRHSRAGSGGKMRRRQAGGRA